MQQQDVALENAEREITARMDPADMDVVRTVSVLMEEDSAKMVDRERFWLNFFGSSLAGFFGDSCA